MEYMKHNQKAINIMIEFVEGRMDIYDFWNFFNNNKIIKETLEIDPNRVKTVQYNYDLISYLEKQDIKSIKGKYKLHFNINSFLDRNGYKINTTSKYKDDYLFIVEVSPPYVEECDEELIKTIITETANKLEGKKLLNYCKKRIKEEYKYDHKPPRWIQAAEWPIRNGKPLIFKYQNKETINDERVNYFFYDPYTNEEIIIQQSY